MTRPTADQCVFEVIKLLNEDFEKHGYLQQDYLPIPVRTYSLVKEGIEQAYRKCEV